MADVACLGSCLSHKVWLAGFRFFIPAIEARCPLVQTPASCHGLLRFQVTTTRKRIASLGLLIV